MDWTTIITAIISAITTTLCAYLAIIPQIKKNKLDSKEIEEAINNSSALLSIKEGLLTEMRKSLMMEYWEYANRGFDLSQSEIDAWNKDITRYKNLGGNGIIAEFDASLQISLIQREKARKDDRVRSF